MRIVLDTNVIVSGFLTASGAPARVLDLVLTGELILLYGDRIIAEYVDVLTRARFKFPRSIIDPVLGAITTRGERVIAIAVDLLFPDEDDVPFIEVALSGHADVLVTGNVKHFVPLNGHHGMRILTPRELLDELD